MTVTPATKVTRQNTRINVSRKCVTSIALKTIK